MNTPLRHCPRCGAASFATVDGRLYRCDRCEFNFYHNNAAAVTAVIRHGTRIAWTLRGREPGRGMLDLPGGFVDPGESLETAMLREIEEELGVSLRAPRYLFSLPNEYPYRDVLYQTTDAFFEFELDAPFAANLDHDEVLRLEWLQLEEVDVERIAFVAVRNAVQLLRGLVPGA